VPDRLAAEVLEETWTARRPAELRAYPEARSVLLALRERNFAVGLCSNWGWDLADDVEQVGLAGCFDVVVSSAQAGARKPHARIFRYALDRLGARANEVLFVGDTVVADVHGPLRVGMRAAYLRRPAAAAWPGLGGGDQEIDPDPPVLPSGVPWIEDLADLPRLLDVDGLVLPGQR
jgi:putative hydrolase of the HAD superfamily